ncbi:LysR substrate-binding domain-containing protein [Tatumella terrea]|uniref:LysR substrate-binding domain-containing protein n=1 Tax=Tatumella terrea TaxID=419007 RepID=A0ABW1VVC9_9GAMM
MSLPPLYALRAFEAAARLNSFSQAAELLNITPGAVSRHIRTLEAWFGCELFKRNGPRVKVSEAGRTLAGQLTEGFMSIEQACHTFRSQSQFLRLKVPSTLTMRWLLDVLSDFRQDHKTPVIQISSVWMDIDEADFSREPFDCAILLGNGHFGKGTESRLLFSEWLIPVCSPAMLASARTFPEECDLIHPSPDRRDWRRWLKRTGHFKGLTLSHGKVFDTLEQGNLAALSGHGISVGDLLLSTEAVRNGLLSLPFPEAVATGDGYYLVWPENSVRSQNVELLLKWLKRHIPQPPDEDVIYLEVSGSEVI